MTSTDITGRQEFDLDFRPPSYWGPQSLETWYGTRLTGELRRMAVKRVADDYVGDADFLEPTLDPGLRSAIAGVHPALMSGEYLPPLMPTEVEIARVVLRSTLGDVTSIRARRTRHRIVYRIVDEYMEDGVDRFEMRPATSRRPLSLRQLIAAIDANDLIDGPRDGNFENSTYNEVFDFATVSSEYYPHLESWYDAANEAWRQAREAEFEEEDDEDEADGAGSLGDRR